jgi:hypothetical protein
MPTFIYEKQTCEKIIFYAFFISLMMVSCKKEIEKISDKINDTTSSISEPDPETDSVIVKKDSVVEKNLYLRQCRKMVFIMLLFSLKTKK